MKKTSRIGLLVSWIALMMIGSAHALGGELAAFQPSLKTSADPGSNLYVVLGGNGTCRNPLSSQIPGLINAKLFDAFNRWILWNGVAKRSDNVIYACYEWLSPQMQYYNLRAGVSQMTIIDETQLDDVVIASAQNVRKIIIIGHSHAGWRAMKLASSPALLNATNVPIVLASMDPVSRVTCQQVRQPGCREAPRDFSAEEFYQLNTRTTWLNIYHQPAVFLGSGPIAAAHYNLHVLVNHISMENDNSTWRSVTQFVVNNL